MECGGTELNYVMLAQHKGPGFLPSSQGSQCSSKESPRGTLNITVSVSSVKVCVQFTLVCLF